MAATLCTAPVLAQPPGEADQGFRALDGDSLYSLPRSQEEISALQSAQADLDAGRLADGVTRLRAVIATESRGLVPIGVERYQGVTLAAIRMLQAAGPMARERYEKLVSVAAGRLAEQPPHSLDAQTLEELARRFPASRVGQGARLRLGELALERGDAAAAANLLRGVVDAAVEGSDLQTRASRQLRRAAVLLDPRPHRLEGELAAAVLAALPESRISKDWRAIASGNSAVPMDPPIGRNHSLAGFDLQADVAHPLGMYAVGGLDGLFLNDGGSVWCIDPLTGEPAWHAPGPRVQFGLSTDVTRSAANRDMVFACALGDGVVVAALEVPPRQKSRVYRRGNIDIINALPERRLFAFDRSSGKLVWSHFDELDGPMDRAFQSHLAAGPPVIVGDTVYVASHDRNGPIAFYLTAYDLYSGKTRWRRLLCSSQQEVNMFGNARNEFAASPLCVHEGVIYGVTNLGLAFAAEAASGDVRWLSGYEVIPLPRTQLRGQESRPVFYANNPPAVVDGIMVCTPLDSRAVVAFDVETGTRVWQLPFTTRRPGGDAYWILGVIGDEVILAGDSITGVTVQPTGSGDRPSVRTIVSQGELTELNGGRRYRARILGCGAVAGDKIFYPYVGGVTAFDRRGERATTSPLPFPQGGGNLLLVDGMAVSVRSDRTQIAVDRDLLQRRSWSVVQQQPDNLEALRRLALLLAADAQGEPEGPDAKRAMDMFQRALDAARQQGMGPGSATWQQLAGEWFRLAMRRAMANRSEVRLTLARLREARELAPDPNRWIQAQLRILELLERPEEQLDALAELAATHGTEVYRFGDIGRLPVAAWATWRRAQMLGNTDPGESLLAWQEVLERHGSIEVGSQPLRTAADIAIDLLLENHGRSIYGPVEVRAQEELAQAGRDPSGLEALVQRFPHSEAAQTARIRALDLAVLAGDLGAAAEAFAGALRNGAPSAGMLRRLMAAADRSGNDPLARAVAERLQQDHRKVASDLELDGGRTMGAVADTWLANNPPLTAAALNVDAIQVPLTQLEVVGLQPGKFPDRLPCNTAPGFPVAPDRPTYVLFRSEAVAAVDIASGEPGPAKVLFERPVSWCEEVLLCGDVLLVPDYDRIAAVHYRTGKLLWERKLPQGRSRTFLGARDGLVHHYSGTQDNRSGGTLLGIEPLTGKIVFERRFNPLRTGIPVVASGDHLVTVTTQRRQPAPDLQWLDPLTGGDLHTVRVTEQMLQQVGFRQIPLDRRTVVDGMHTSGDLIVWALAEDRDDMPLRVLAIRPDGTMAWNHRSGERGAALLASGIHRHPEGDRLVVVTTNNNRSGELLVLDCDRGRVIRRVPFENDMTLVGWRDSADHRLLPDALHVSDVAGPDGRGGIRLTCVGLAPNVPSFQLQLPPDAEEVLPTPILTGSFYAAPFRNRRGDHELLVLDPKTRRSMLPRGAPSLPLAVPRDALHMFPQGDRLLLQSSLGFHVLGDTAR